MNHRTIVLACLTLGGVFILAHQAQGQVYNPGRRLMQDQIFRRPTVSPYLNLLQEQGLGLPNYQTLVRPQIQQQRASQQQARQVQELRLEVARNAAADQQGEVGLRPTGHQTVFRTFGRYYPRLSTRRR